MPKQQVLRDAFQGVERGCVVWRRWFAAGMACFTLGLTVPAAVPAEPLREAAAVRTSVGQVSELSVEVMAVMGLAILAAAAWALALRRRLGEQTALIRQRHEHEQALQARYRELFENIPHPLFVFDQETLRFLVVNQAAIDHYGYTRQEFLQLTLKDIRPATELDVLMKHLAQAQNQATRQVAHARHRTKDGEIIDVEISSHEWTFEGRAARVVLVTDITERLQRDQEVRRTREFQNSVIDNLPTAVFIKEAQELRFVLWNKAGAELVGYTQAELMGKNDYDFFPKEEADHFTAKDREALTTGQLVEIQEEVIATRHHGRRIVRTKKIPIFDLSGKPTHLLGICEDITDRKRAEAELERAQRELVEVSRQAGMAEVATSVLHNVGNVLNSANVSASLLAERLKRLKTGALGKVSALLDEHTSDLGAFFTTDPKGKLVPGYLRELAEVLARGQQEAMAELDSLRQNIEHIKDIVAMQQSYAKVAGMAEIVNITDIVEDALRLSAGALTRHGIQVVRQFQELPPVNVERHKVLQILVNLVRNASNACNDSGRPDKRLTLSATNGDDKIRISISDNGIGIPPENLTRIFCYGFTTRRDGHGFGLHSGALAAKEMGGELTVHSDGPGHGATFTLAIPREAPRAQGR